MLTNTSMIWSTHLRSVLITQVAVFLQSLVDDVFELGR